MGGQGPEPDVVGVGRVPSLAGGSVGDASLSTATAGGSVGDSSLFTAAAFALFQVSHASFSAAAALALCYGQWGHPCPLLRPVGADASLARGPMPPWPMRARVPPHGNLQASFSAAAALALCHGRAFFSATPCPCPGTGQWVERVFFSLPLPPSPSYRPLYGKGGRGLQAGGWGWVWRCTERGGGGGVGGGRVHEPVPGGGWGLGALCPARAGGTLGGVH